MQPRNKRSPSEPRNDETAIVSLGIKHVPVDGFHSNGYRQNTLKDALAAARHAEPRGAGDA